MAAVIVFSKSCGQARATRRPACWERLPGLGGGRPAPATTAGEGVEPGLDAPMMGDPGVMPAVLPGGLGGVPDEPGATRAPGLLAPDCTGERRPPGGAERDGVLNE